MRFEQEDRWKGKGIASYDRPTSEEKSAYFTNKSLQNRTWKLIHYSKLLRPNYQLEHCINKRKEKNNKTVKICNASGENLPYFFLGSKKRKGSAE